VDSREGRDIEISLGDSGERTRGFVGI